MYKHILTWTVYIKKNKLQEKMGVQKKDGRL